MFLNPDKSQLDCENFLRYEIRTSQELRMLSTFTLICQITKNVMNSDCNQGVSNVTSRLDCVWNCQIGKSYKKLPNMLMFVKNCWGNLQCFFGCKTWDFIPTREEESTESELFFCRKSKGGSFSE